MRSLPRPTVPDLGFHRAVPLYYKLGLLFKERVRSGEWPAGGSIPGELQLCREFGASRGTIAQAVGLLVDEGLLVRARGRGTFVAGGERVSTTTRLNTPVSEYLYQGIPVRITKVTKKIIRLPAPVAAFFNLPAGEPGVRVARQRTYEGLPLSYAISYLPRRIGSRISGALLRQQSLLFVLEKELGFKVGRIRQSVELALADLEVARALRIPLSTPTLLIQMEIRTREDEPLDFGLNYFRADRYRYTQEFDRRSTESRSANKVR